MKIKFLLPFCIVLFCFLNTKAQQFRQKSKRNQTITVRRGEANSYMPIPNGVTLEYYTPEVSQKTLFLLYFSEYINGKEQKDDLSEIVSIELTAGEKVKRFQIVPDISRENHFILFSFLPMGAIRFNHCFSKKDTKFEYLTFNANEEQSLNTKTPLLIVFEDKSELDQTLRSLNKKATDPLCELDFKKLTSSDFPVKKLRLLYYVLKKQE